MVKSKFAMQAFLSFIIVGFCIFQLQKTTVVENDKTYYWTGITTILAYWLPSPKEPDARD